MRSPKVKSSFIRGYNNPFVQISVAIGKGITEINCSVISFLSGGSLSFIIFDPEGKREGGFGLDAVGEKGEIKPGSGRMTHNIKSPLAGTWTIKFKTTDATGNLFYKIHIK